MMIDGWGVAVDRRHQRLRPGHRRVAGRAGRGARRLGHRRGPGLARPPGLRAVTLGLIHGATPQAMVLVHKPGQTEHDFDHLPDASFPIARARAVHRAPRAGRRARRAVEGRRDRAEHVALSPTTTRRAGSSRRSPPRRACRPTTRSGSAATRLWAGRSATRVSSALPWVLTPPRHEVLSPRACATRSGSPAPTTTPGTRSRRSSSSCATTDYPGVVGLGEGYPDRFYGETAETMAAVLPLLLAAVERAARARRDGLARAARPTRWPAAIRGHGGAKCALDIALHDLVGKVAGPAGPRAARPAGGSRRPTSRSGIDEPAVVAERRPARGRLPGAQDQGRRAGRPRDARGGPRGLRRADPGRRQHRLDPRRRASRSCPSSVDLGVELIEQPFPAAPAATLGWLQERSSLPIVADESARHDRGPRRARRRRRRRQRQAGQVRRRRAGAADARAGPRARLPDVPRLHGGDVGRDRGVGGRRVARRLGRPRRQPAPRRRPVRRASSSATTGAGGCPIGPGLGLRRAPAEPRVTPYRTAFSERPFVWTSSWTKWWTNPLPAGAGRAYHVATPVAEPQDGSGTQTRPTVPRTQSPTGRPGRASYRCRARRLGPVRRRAPERREGTPSMDATRPPPRESPTRTRSSSSASATAAGASAGRSCMTRCAPSPAAACTAAGRRRARRARDRLRPLRDAGAGALVTRSSPRSNAAGPDRVTRRRDRGRRRRRRRGRPGATDRRRGAPGLTGTSRRGPSRRGRVARQRGQARIRRLAISPSIWRSAST